MKYQGITVEECLEKGLTDLNKKIDEVTYEVLNPGKKGFLGIGQQDAVIEITVKEIADQPKKGEEPVAKEVTKTAEEVKQEQEKAKKAKEWQAKMDEAIHDLGYYLADVTQKMGIEVTINVIPEKHVVSYNFETPTEGALIGKHGRTINSLQVIAQDYLDRKLHRRVKVMLNVANYREKRTETLTRLANKLAKEVAYKQQPRELDPMPAFERKAIHAALAKNAKVKTHSKGKEPYRFVMIEPIK